MDLNCLNHDNIDRFFGSVAYKQAAYSNSRVAFLALKIDGMFCILRGGLYMDTGIPRPEFQFRSENVWAASYPLSEFGIQPRGLIEALLAGKVSTPCGELGFRPNEGGTFSALYDPFKPGSQAQLRFDSLTIFGGSLNVRARQLAIDWELKAAATPYNDLQEIAVELGIGLVDEKISFEMVAFNVAVIDSSTSTITGTRGTLIVRLAHGLERAKTSIGYRVIIQGKVIERRSISGDAMQWDEVDVQRGTVEIGVPAASVLHCVASYEGIAQSHFWVADPAMSANARRVVYELADSKLEVLTEFLTRPQTKGRDARDLEAGVAWLLWILGFSVAHLGATARMQEAPDLVATTPNGHFAVIECTTGLLKAENKLARLVERAESVRQRCSESNNRHLRVLPVIVTSLTRAQVVADIEAAERLKVLVMTREDLEQGPLRTLAPPNADKIFEESERAVQAAFDQYAVQLPLPSADDRHLLNT